MFNVAPGRAYYWSVQAVDRRAFAAMMEMGKIDIAKIEAARHG